MNPSERPIIDSATMPAKKSKYMTLNNEESRKICASPNWMHLACYGPVKYQESGKAYCVMHCPNQDKTIDFQIAFDKKKEKKDFVFVGAWFPSEVDLSDYSFEGHAWFRSAFFSERLFFRRTTFQTADFGRAEFRKEAIFEKSYFHKSANFAKSKFYSTANFDRCDFPSLQTEEIDSLIKTKFSDAKFMGNATFDRARFQGKIDFRSVLFEQPVRFYQTIFQNAELLFGFASFKNQVRFADIILDENSSIKLFSAMFEKPEQAFFNKMDLHPHYFVNVDTRKFNFEDVEFPVLAKNNRVRIEINNIRDKFVTNTPNELLAITCRRLAFNAEENNRFEEASAFRSMALESQRLLTSHGLAFWKLSWWYWLSSLYGESWRRALLILAILVFVVFPIIFAQTQFQTCPTGKPLTMSLGEDMENEDCVQDGINCNCKIGGLGFRNGEAIAQSLAAVTFQNVEYRRPLTVSGEVWTTLEKIFAPLQAALLALAIRRKFIR